MGVPKFFRYMSERYPCLSEVIKEYQIPEFDNLYLDMNGIIHNCSHPNDNDPHFRITEKQIFQDIFHYIEILFRMIQPKQLFFMAIDGVAPRAKMNQQRGRRFRSAKEMEMLEAKAKEKGEVLPSEKRFDSNCITPGTPFMCRLHQQLRYFVKMKVTTDKLWRNVKIILSGHETPGEGEHKIMDYIRYMKSKPDYDPNLRHCLYGLDADLIMLGLCTHEPFFSLLREEVKFNTKSNKGGNQILTPEETKFFLLHLSLMRDYLELEFSQLKRPGVLRFPFDIERIVDDWILMGFLIGNDFIPNLPDLHIINGALPLMYKVYQEVLPTLDGYINEAGDLNLTRFEKFMTKLASFDFEQFREKYADIQYLEGKTGKKFTDVFYGKGKTSSSMDPGLAALIKATDEDFDFDDGSAEVLNYADYEEYYYSDEDNEWRTNFFSEFGQHKTDYYRYKLDYEKVTNDVLRDQAECYVRAIQWNLHYYYNGCVSWSWYYPHHYAPYISDIKDFANMKLTYDMGEPFLPFQQLLAVLPAASKELLPKPYQDLMTLENSSIVDYYPADFQTDLNGKKQDWEAVVLIPFIDERRLISAMNSVEHLLTDEERSRNVHGPMMVYTYTNEHLGVWEAPEYFPPIQENHALEKALWRQEIFVHRSKLVKGLCKNVKLNLYRTQFPTLKHLDFSHKLENAKVKVFQQPSRGESMILTLAKSSMATMPNLKYVADQILGQTIFINYPHLVEIKVLAVSSQNNRISLDKGVPVFERASKDVLDRFLLSKKSITDDYFSKLGINIGNTEILVYGLPVEGRRYMFGARGKVSQQKTYIRTTVTYAYQTAVLNVPQPRDMLEFKKSIDEIFYAGCQCFTLSRPYYGSEGTVIGTVKDENSFIKLSLKVQMEPDLTELMRMKNDTYYSYMPAYTVASKLSISPLLLSRFTGSIFIYERPEDEGGRRQNIGLNIKFSRKNEEVVGFTRRDEQTKKWFYTEKVVQLIKDYMQNFPEVFDFLRDHATDDIYLRSDVFPKSGEQRVTQIVNWLKEQPHSKAEVRPCGASMVDDKIVELIERTVDRCEKSEKRMTLLVKPNKLCIPKCTLDKVCVDPDTQFELFDRVVNIRDSYTVPLGYRGTVIGITQGETMYDTMCDVVFDQPFPHGVKIRCSESRGYRMPVQAMINLTFGERMLGNGNNQFIKNIIQSRNKNNTSSVNYTNAVKQPVRDGDKGRSTSSLKENTPPLVPSSYHHAENGVFSKSNNANVSSSSQQGSPHSGNLSRRLSQDSSSGNVSRQSPASATLLSQQSSPFVNHGVSKSPVEPKNNLTTCKSNENSNKLGQTKGASTETTYKPFMNKEARRIFSIPTFPTSLKTSSEVSASRRSFFGHPNLLDMPDTQNKLFDLAGDQTATTETNRLTPSSTDSDKSKASPTSLSETLVNVNINNISKTEVDSNGPNRTYPKTLFETGNGVDVVSQSSTSSGSITFIPSISKIVEQNSITAKTDFLSENSTSSLNNLIYSNASFVNSNETSTSLSETLSNLFNRSHLNRNVSNDRNAIADDGPVNDFERAVSALKLQSPLLFEQSSNKESSSNTPAVETGLNSAEDDFSFETKHGLDKISGPTITTEMRKITKASSLDIEENDDEEEEVEEVMTIEIKEKVDKLKVDSESKNDKGVPTSAPNDTTVNNVKEFFANLNIDRSRLSKNVLGNIPCLDKVETAVTNSSTVSNVANITADTINDFFAQAEEYKKKEDEAAMLKKRKVLETNLNASAANLAKRNDIGGASLLLGTAIGSSGGPPGKSYPDMRNTHVSSDFLRKMLNIDADPKNVCATTASSEIKDVASKSVRDNVSVQDQPKVANPFVSNPNVHHPNITSAFKVVRPPNSQQEGASTEVGDLKKETTTVFNSKLKASATSFIPSQVQKQILIKNPQSFSTAKVEPPVNVYPNPAALLRLQQQTAQQQGKTDSSFVSGASYIRPKPTFPNPLQARDENIGHLSSSAASSSSTPPRGKPILGSQANIYNPPTMYYQNQASLSQVYYSGLSLQQVQYQQSLFQQGVQQPPLVPQQIMPNSHLVQPLATKNSTLQPTSQLYNSQQQPVPPNPPRHWPPPQNYQQPLPNNFQPYQQPVVPPQFVPGGYVQPLQQQHFTRPHLVPQQYGQLSSGMQQITAPNLGAPGSSQVANKFDGFPASLVEEKTDSYLLKLLKLTKLHKLGSPDYSFEMDDGKMFVTTVRIAHPHSDIVIRGKACSKKADSVEVCARIAYHELCNTYLPVTFSKSNETGAGGGGGGASGVKSNVSAPKIAQTKKSDVRGAKETSKLGTTPLQFVAGGGDSAQSVQPSTSGDSAAVGSANSAGGGDSSEVGNSLVKKSKKIRMAANFNVPFQPGK